MILFLLFRKMKIVYTQVERGKKEENYAIWEKICPNN